MGVSKTSGKLRCYLCSRFADKQKKIILHSFPKPSPNKNHFKKWLYVLDLNERDEVRNLKICCKHFTEVDYITPSLARLKPGAVPSVKVPNPLPQSDCEQSAAQKHVSETEDSSGSAYRDIRGACAVSNGEVVADDSVNSIEAKRIILEGAESSVQRTARNATDDCIVWNQETSLERRGRSISSVTDAETETNKFKANSFLLQRGVRLLNSLLSAVSERKGPIPEVEVTNTGPYNLTVLLKDIKRGPLPNHWSLSEVGGKVCLKYFGDYPEMATRTVIIKDDMTIMVQSRGKIFSKLELGTITCQEDLLNALKRIGLLHFCEGLDGVCYGEGLSDLKTRSRKCSVCSRQQKRIMERVKKANERALLKKARQAAKTSQLKQGAKKVYGSRKRRSSTSILAARLLDLEENSPLPIEEEESSLIAEMDEWRNRDEERDPLELAESDRCPLSDPISRLEDDEPRPLSSHSFTVPRYLLDLMISRLRRTRLELRSTKDALHVQTMHTESLQETNEKLLEKITDFRRKVFQLELQQIVRGCIEGDERVLVNKGDNTPYNLKKAENDFLALRCKGLMPRLWSFITTSAGLLFFFENKSEILSWPIAKSVLLRPDMTLSIRLFDRPMPMVDFGQMKSTIGILTALDSIASIRPCVGVCGNCLGEGIIGDEVRYSERCVTCRKERKRLRLDVKRKKSALRLKAEKKKHRNTELKNLKRKLKRWQEKAKKEEKEITRLRQENLFLTQQHSSTSGIKSIPSVHQEVVVTSST